MAVSAGHDTGEGQPQGVEASSVSSLLLRVLWSQSPSAFPKLLVMSLRCHGNPPQSQFLYLKNWIVAKMCKVSASCLACSAVTNYSDDVIGRTVWLAVKGSLMLCRKGAGDWRHLFTFFYFWGERAPWSRALAAPSRGPRFSPQHLHGSSLPSTTVLGDPIPCSSLCRHCVHMAHRNTGRQNTMHIKERKKCYCLCRTGWPQTPEWEQVPCFNLPESLPPH